ncbi:hypothetical protein [Roseiconus lacunae]|uniref:Lycopene cyclase domain-containing protein n=1 Tax=Roseiconus lacunae TaxID=2605694 RepID=A0ABT7PHD7_9BACT|nr:hypothetical protein [Roseiconus lacunae]MDM4015912.1 hypothetical protein [Roseiconus lacunae]
MVYLLSLFSLLALMSVCAIFLIRLIERRFTAYTSFQVAFAGCFSAAIGWELFFLIDSLVFGGMYNPEVHSYGSGIAPAATLFCVRVVFHTVVFLGVATLLRRLKPWFYQGTQSPIT